MTRVVEAEKDFTIVSSSKGFGLWGIVDMAEKCEGQIGVLDVVASVETMVASRPEQDDSGIGGREAILSSKSSDYGFNMGVKEKKRAS